MGKIISLYMKSLEKKTYREIMFETIEDIYNYKIAKWAFKQFETIFFEDSLVENLDTTFNKKNYSLLDDYMSYLIDIIEGNEVI